MGEKLRSNLKRPFLEDDDSNKPPAQKKVRFPKGKKVKAENVVVGKGNTEDDPADLKDPRLAAKERAKRRSQMTTELFCEESKGLNDVSAAEVTYEDNENLIEDGINIEPFNLNKEREEGYFDAEGNFIEYVNENEIKDAWLDSIEANPKYSRVASATNDIENEDDEEDNNEDAGHDLSSEDIGMIKRRIANVLEPGETVLHALRRLKGTSNNKKEKMSSEMKHVFDQLTEDADKLIQNGEYNVYHEKQEVFEREAEGYEMLTRAKENGGSDAGKNLLPDVNDTGVGSSILSNSAAGTSKLDVTAADIGSSGDDAYDMFADEDEYNTDKSSNNRTNLSSGPNSDAVNQSSSNSLNMDSESGALQTSMNDGSSDYIYDESSGYYYSSSLGYYYDPSTGLYYSAALGQWYSFNEETGQYEKFEAHHPA
ncbi:uncharacterized protein LOC110815269 [Carica papaya]|uniref:uncharacterized protein LOC110815269 n=1 Tax=Carica papaya TaxID=3649 RepID=UPI000B8CEF42|nr:uncharacterized protein LOC110815269 [Carica papaya]